MDKRPPALAIALAVAPLPAAAAPDSALETLAFLAGHCRVGTMPGTADTVAKQVEYFYVTAAGGHAVGKMTVAARRSSSRRR